MTDITQLDLSSAVESMFKESFSTSNGAIIAETLVAWDKVKGNFGLIRDQLEKVVNTIIRIENKIHIEFEKRRKWAEAKYEIDRFEYDKNQFKVFIFPNRVAITGEQPDIECIIIPVEIVIKAHEDSTFSDYFNNYREKIETFHSKLIEDRRLLEEERFKFRFIEAKNFYFANKDHFEALEKEIEVNILPYDEWEAKFYGRKNDQEMKKYFEAMHDINLDEEIEKIKKNEYNIYVEHVKLGIK